MNRVLVTGATGFLGRHVLAPLAAGGCEVHALSSRVRPEEGGSAGLVHWHRADLFDRAAVRSLLAAVQPHGLMHLAWDTTPTAYWTNPANLEWTAASLHLAQDFAAAGGGRLVMAGTSAEYRWGDDAYLDENTTPLQPDTLYGRCKNALRELLESWAPLAGVSWAWGRIFNLFGPEEKGNRLIPRVIDTLLRAEPLPFDTGEARRDFLHVADAGAAFAALYTSGVCGAVNVASGEATTTRQLVTTIADCLGAAGQVAFGTRLPPPGQPACVAATVRRLREEVGWQARVSLAERLRETCAWWRTAAAPPVAPL